MTVSRIYPVPDVEEFTAAPLAGRGTGKANAFPEIEWSLDDFKALRQRANLTTLAALRLCSARPGELIPFREIVQGAGCTHEEAKGQLAGLTMTLKNRFGRSNQPIQREWAAGGEQQFYYRVTPELAERWKQADNEVDSIPSTQLPEAEVVRS